MSNKNKSTIIFDLGNVVLFFDHNIICRRLSHTYNIDEQLIFSKIFEGELERQFDEGKLSPEDFTVECSKALNVELDALEFKMVWSDIFSENSSVMDIIKEIKHNSKVFLLSNTNTWHIEHIRKHFNILELFDELIFSYQVGYSKPHRKIFERAMEKCGDSKMVIYIDDLEEHVKAALNVGFQSFQYKGIDSLRSALNSKGIL